MFFYQKKYSKILKNTINLIENVIEINNEDKQK